MRRWLSLPLLLLPLVAAAAECPQDDKKCELDESGIADNSFLVEEAYNQEYGVVQHIQSWRRDWPSGEWEYTFTQEWPFDPAPRHQLSYTIPVLHPDAAAGSGIGDVLLNYRYQLVGADGGPVAFAPRVSLLLPTGDWRRERGMGTTGVQLQLPLSVELGGRFVTHWNVGGTLQPGAKDATGDEADAFGYNFGQSVVWRAHPRFNVLLETVFQSEERVVAPGETERQNSWLLNPGVRWAWNFGNGLQIVPGVSVPVGVGATEGARGVLLYLSLEHPYRKPKSD